MRLAKTRSLLPIAALLTVLSGSSNAGLVITLTDNGSGGTSGTFVGFYDITGFTASTGGIGNFDEFRSNGDTITFRRRGPAAFSNVLLDFTPTTNTTPILNSSFTSTPTQFGPTDLQIDLSHQFYRFIAYDGNTSNTFNETFDYTTVPFSSFNTGTWEWGGGSGATNGVALNITAVPEPSSALLLVIGSMTVCLWRRRAKGCQERMALNWRKPYASPGL